MVVRMAINDLKCNARQERGYNKYRTGKSAMFFRIRIENMNKYGSMVRCRFSKFELMIDFNLVNLFKEIC